MTIPINKILITITYTFCYIRRLYDDLLALHTSDRFTVVYLINLFIYLPYYYLFYLFYLSSYFRGGRRMEGKGRSGRLAQTCTNLRVVWRSNVPSMLFLTLIFLYAMGVYIFFYVVCIIFLVLLRIFSLFFLTFCTYHLFSLFCVYISFALFASYFLCLT